MNNTGRRSIRLPGYDYGQSGGYFVTIVAQGRSPHFGEVIHGELRLNDAGQMIQTQWQTISERFAGVELGEFVVMPNHFHALLFIVQSEENSVGAALVAAQSGAGTRPAPTKTTLGAIIGAFKSITTHEYILGVKHLGWPAFDRRLWQRNYYEHIVRSSLEMEKISEYIRYNPVRWDQDRENPILATDQPE